LVVYSPGNIGKILEELDKMEKESGEKKSVSDLREMILPQELTVSGIFQTGRNDYDLEYLLVPLHVGQELYELGDGLHGLTIRTTDPNRVGQLQEQLLTQLPPPLQVLTWIDLNKPIFDAIQMERDVMFIILMFLIVIASFCVMNTLITVTVQKKREIGILKALGATASQIVWVFLAQGMVVGFFGNITGLALGMTLLHYRNEFKDWLSSVLHREIFSPGIYQFSKIPAELVTSDVVTICVSAFIICSVAALIPAWFAARLDPVKALRYE
jgi:lipoprotein-releasing system permease protein